tara:strand:+ start:100 stop:495 length:396 start_codon:yes stop_codon:yes gene_type:complete
MTYSSDSMQNEKKIDDLLDKIKKTEKKIENFSEILGNLNTAEDKKKALWKEVYENAIADRERASILFTEAYKTMGTSSTDHVAIGTTMSKYLERMCKSNDQILQLADLINKAEQREEKVDPDDLFNKIAGK